MDTTRTPRNPARTPAQQRNLLLIGGIIIAAVLVAVIAIVVSNTGNITGSASGYDSLHKERLADGGFILGDPNAPITVVEFADFACPHCQTYSATMHQFIEDYVTAGKARFEYRMFISAADPTYGPYVAQLAECADTLEPGSFWVAHDVLFELGSRGRFNQQTARTLADRIGLGDRYSELLSCASNASQYTTDVRLGTSLGVQSTPTVMIRIGDSRPQFIEAGGRTWDRGPVSYEILRAVVDSFQS
jgi:protein-disulfide isomerase